MEGPEIKAQGQGFSILDPSTKTRTSKKDGNTRIAFSIGQYSIFKYLTTLDQCLSLSS